MSQESQIPFTPLKILVLHLEDWLPPVNRSLKLKPKSGQKLCIQGPQKERTQFITKLDQYIKKRCIKCKILPSDFYLPSLRNLQWEQQWGFKLHEKEVFDSGSRILLDQFGFNVLPSLNNNFSQNQGQHVIFTCLNMFYLQVNNRICNLSYHVQQPSSPLSLFPSPPTHDVPPTLPKQNSSRNRTENPEEPKQIVQVQTIGQNHYLLRANYKIFDYDYFQQWRRQNKLLKYFRVESHIEGSQIIVEISIPPKQLESLYIKNSELKRDSYYYLNMYLNYVDIYVLYDDFQDQTIQQALEHISQDYKLLKLKLWAGKKPRGVEDLEILKKILFTGRPSGDQQFRVIKFQGLRNYVKQKKKQIGLKVKQFCKQSKDHGEQKHSLLDRLENSRTITFKFPLTGYKRIEQAINLFKRPGIEFTFLKNKTPLVLQGNQSILSPIQPQIKKIISNLPTPTVQKYIINQFQRWGLSKYSQRIFQICLEHCAILNKDYQGNESYISIQMDSSHAEIDELWREIQALLEGKKRSTRPASREQLLAKMGIDELRQIARQCHVILKSIDQETYQFIYYKPSDYNKLVKRINLDKN